MSEAWASDSGHWYKPDGTPCYEIVGKNGKLRSTTLRDARVMGLLPSVTTIIKEANAPGLINWKIEQMLMAALTTTRRDGEPEKAWIDRIRSDSTEQARKAAQRGSAIHGAIEKHYYRGIPDEEWWDWVKVARQHIIDRCGPELPWRPERSFACSHGFGGRVDLHCDTWVLDFKTKDGVEDAMTYDEHAMQLGAYRVGLGIPSAQCGILFIDRLSPTCRLVEIEQDKLDRGWRMFQHLLGYWTHKTGYKPSVNDDSGVAAVSA